MRLVVSNGARTWGGLEQMTELLALGLTARGHEVVLFCRRNSPLHVRLGSLLPCEPILRGGRLDPITVARCYMALRRHRPDAVIGNTAKEPSWTGIAGRALGIPFLYRHEFNSPYPSHPRDRLVFGWVPAMHVVNSRASRDTVVASAPWIPGERVRVVPNGIRFEESAGAGRTDLALPPGAVTFGFVGRFEEGKGIVELAEAWPRVVSAVPNAHLMLVGWGHLEAFLNAELAPAPNVHMLGFREDVPALMNAFDVLVAPFHQDGFGLVLVEAMAAGVPVVAARASATPEIVDDGVEGKLVPVRDASALANAMIELGRDAGLRARLGRAGRARAARDFRWERMVEEHELLLEELTGASRPGRPSRTSAPGGPRTG